MPSPSTTLALSPVKWPFSWRTMKATEDRDSDFDIDQGLASTVLFVKAEGAFSEFHSWSKITSAIPFNAVSMPSASRVRPRV